MSDRDLLMIPGPIELEPRVLAMMAEKQRGHLDPVFINRFSRTLKRLREVFDAPTAQPFVIAGTGTLAMELAAANLAQPGDHALVVNTGYFSDRMGLMLERHGAQVTHVRAAPGQVPELAEVERALAAQRFALMTVTHVDTSTGVLAPVQALAALARKYDALCVVDGVCSVGAEALHQDAWGVDLALTGSQKALGAPPGLAVVMAGPRAMQAWRARRAPVRSMYLDFGEWLAVHEAYEAEKPSYFATPAVNLISALDVSLGLILEEGMPARTARHVKLATAMRAASEALGLQSLPAAAVRAHSLSALYYPAGVDAALVKAVAAQGVTIAGGLHPELKTKYFRVGHMGAVSANDVMSVISALERALLASKVAVTPGAGIAAAERVLGA
jgi:alanine-glyoxylate transaminase / serine-glyoxylate transaminase / serine-pyruvate transaminase